MWLLYVAGLMAWVVTVLCWHQARIWIRKKAVAADTQY